GVSNETVPGSDSPRVAAGDSPLEVLGRVLRSRAPGARIEEAGTGWLRSPGRAFADAVKSADIVALELSPTLPSPLYALGLARGAGKPVVALARRGVTLSVDPGALDVTLYEGDRELAARLDRRLGEALKPKQPRGEDPHPERSAKRGAKRGRRRPRGGRKPREARTDSTATNPPKSVEDSTKTEPSDKE
ncbi:MAG: hypothetical protein ACYDCK_13545, partial [Thermoplasmatota archaeon]